MATSKLPSLPVESLLKRSPTIAGGVPEGLDALLLGELARHARHGGAVLHVARDANRLSTLEEAIPFFAPDVQVLSFPAWDGVPYDRVAPNAETIAERHSLEVLKTEEMSEISHGSWEGMHLEAVIDAHGKLYDTWLNNPHKAKMPGGEDLNDVRERAVRKLMDIVEITPDGSTVLIVGHDATNKVILCYALGLDNSHFWQFKQGNASISILEYEDGMFRLMLLNDTCHLGGVLDMTTNGAL